MRTADIFFMLAFGCLVSVSFISIVKIQAPKSESLKIIKDPATKCQYLVYGNAMYPRLDDRRNHICSELNKYYFEPGESNGM